MAVTTINVTNQSYTTVKEENTALTQRNVLKFTGAGVTAADTGGETVVTIPGAGVIQAYDTVQNEGSNLAQRTTIDFVGAGVTASDAGGKTVVTIPGAAVIQAYDTVQNEGSNLTQRTTIDFVGAGVTAADNGSKTIVTIPGLAATTNYGLFAQTANSTAITGTNVETTLINGGVGTLTVPANGFSIGDSFRAVVAGVLSAANNQTIRIRVKAGSIILLDSGLQPITNITNDVFSLNIDFTIRALGAPTVASIVSLGTFHYIKTSNAATQGFAFNQVNNTTFNTTISNTLNITVQWGSNNGGNSIFSDIFILNKTY